MSSDVMMQDVIPIAKVKKAYGLSLEQCQRLASEVPCQWSGLFQFRVDVYVGEAKPEQQNFFYESAWQDLKRRNGACDFSTICSLAGLLSRGGLKHFEYFFADLTH